jgi:uncharacterized protein
VTTGEHIRTPHEVIEQFHRYGFELNLEKEADLFAPDGVAEWPMAPEGVVRRAVGPEEVRAALTPPAELLRTSGVKPRGFSRYTLHETLDPEVLIADFEVESEMPDGEVCVFPYVYIFRIRDGKILSFRDYYSPATAAAVTP